jgi:hypothetical protein
MSGKIKVLCVIVVAVAVALIGFFAIPKSEGAKPSGDIQLRAVIWNSTGTGAVSKIQNDGQGDYISGVAQAGTVDIYIDQRYGYARFYIDKGTNASIAGRSVSLFFDDPVVGKPVMWMDPCPPETDPLEYTSIVPQIFGFRIPYLFSQDPTDPTLLHQEAPAGLDFRTMGMTVTSRKTTTTYPAQAYAGMTINYYITAGGDIYNVGGSEYAVMVMALEFNGPNGAPSHWKIESLTPPMHKDDAEDDDRMLYHTWDVDQNTTARCGYAWFHFPFEIDLYRK